MKKASLSRRMFLGSSVLFTTSSFMLLQGCDKKVQVYANETQVLLHTAYHLFPQSKVGPSAKELYIASYLAFVLQDTRIMKSDRDYLLKGAYWLEETSFEEYDKSFLNLNTDEKEELLQDLKEHKWARNYMYTTLGYIFEALLCTPVYGSNPKEIGWKWLEHQPGFPQPKNKKETIYEV